MNKAKQKHSKKYLITKYSYFDIESQENCNMNHRLLVLLVLSVQIANLFAQSEITFRFNLKIAEIIRPFVYY